MALCFPCTLNCYIYFRFFFSFAARTSQIAGQALTQGPDDSTSIAAVYWVLWGSLHKAATCPAKSARRSYKLDSIRQHCPIIYRTKRPLGESRFSRAPIVIKRERPTGDSANRLQRIQTVSANWSQLNFEFRAHFFNKASLHNRLLIAKRAQLEFKPAIGQFDR